MSSKKIIDDRVKSLEEREKKVKLQLESNSEEVKRRFARVGKIALISGLLAILGYWIFNIIFQDDEEYEKPKKKKKVKSKGFTERIAALAMPYINNALDDLLSDVNKDEKEQESNEEKD